MGAVPVDADPAPPGAVIHGAESSNQPSRPPGRLGSRPMEFLLLCIVSVLFVFTVGGYFAGRGGD